MSRPYKLRTRIELDAFSPQSRRNALLRSAYRCQWQRQHEKKLACNRKLSPPRAGAQGVSEEKTSQDQSSVSELKPGVFLKDFKLASAVALGCCSFEAYNAPYKHFGLKEVSPCKTETIFMDRDFLASRFQGILEVHLRRATCLPQVELEEGKHQPANSRCRLTVFPSSGFSQVVPSSSDPHWRETFYLYIRDPESQQLEICVEHVSDADEEPNIALGSVTIEDISGLCNGKVQNLVRKLEGSEGSNGQVEISVYYRKHAEDEDILDSLKEQAIWQMMADDWSPTELDWDVPSEMPEWRCSQAQTDEAPTAADDDNPLDVEGGVVAEGQPLDREPWKAWSNLREAVIGRELFTSLSPLAFLVNKETDTEVWIYRCPEKRHIVISFRGTSSPKDMLTDAALDLAAFNPGNNRKSRPPEEVAEDMSEEELENGPMGGLYKGLKALEKAPGGHLINQIIKRKANKTGGRSAPQGLSGWAKAQMMMIYAIEHDEMWCHKGFLQAYEAVKDVIIRIVDEVLEAGPEPDSQSSQKGSDQDESWLQTVQETTQQAVGSLQNKDQWQIFTTGHSLGGALACLCAHEFAVRDYGFGSTPPKVTMYSFGQPRVGNGPFAKQYDQDVPDSWRIKNAEDVVTRVPSLLGYQHIGCEVNLFPHGKVSISGESTDDVREGAVLTDILPKIKGGLTGEDKQLQEEFQQLVKGEIKLAKAIMQGKGVDQHMEDIYHAYLDGCSNRGSEFCQVELATLEDAQEEAAKHEKEKASKNKKK